MDQATYPVRTARTARRVATACAALLALLPFVSGGCSDSAPRGAGAAGTVIAGETYTTEVVTRRILYERSWEIVECLGDRKPQVRRMRPMGKAKKPGDVRMGLTMPPPCEVSFEVRPEDLGFEDQDGLEAGPLRLHAEAVASYMGIPKQGRGRVRLQVFVDGERRFEQEVDLVRRKNPWFPIADGGLIVEPGSVVTLRTDLVNQDPLAIAPVQAGFTTLELRRTRTKPVLEATPEQPNLVLIVMDTLRPDRLGCYGYEKDTTPRLDALAERGTLFEAAYGTASWTWPSTASILTGLWPETHGVTSIHSCFLGAGLQTVAEALSDRGYRTGAFTCNPLVVRTKNFDQGFDQFSDGNIPGIFERGFTNTDKIAKDVADWLVANAGQRFFLYLHLVDTHWAYTHRPESLELVAPVVEPEDYPKGGLSWYQDQLLKAGGPTACDQATLDEHIPPEHQQWLLAQYEAAVHTADANVGDVLDRLAELGLDDRTVVVFTSDHGEELLDHGMPAHGFALYEEHVRVPLILAGPGVPAGRRVKVPVSNRHVGPSLARLGGTVLEAVPDAIDLFAPDRIERRPVFFSTENTLWCGQTPLPSFGVRSGNLVRIDVIGALPWGAPEDAEPPPGEGQLLFDLAEDPGQHHNLYGQQPHLAEELHGTLKRHIGEALEARAVNSIEADDETLEMLRNVGYVGEE